MPILMQKCTIMLILAIILNYYANYKHEIFIASFTVMLQ